MKSTFKFIALAAVSAAGLGFFQSCDRGNDIDYSKVYPNAVVTVKPVDGNKSFYMQLDENTTMEASNLSVSPFGTKEVRALMNFEDRGEKSDKYDRKVHVNWIDSLLTKHLVANLNEGNDEKYGNDPVEFPSSWVTLVEDGYLTLQFITPRGYTGIAHEVNLINAGTEENPYIVEFRHNAHGDDSIDMAAGLVAFKLEDLENGLGLPDTKGETVKLTMRYRSMDNTTKELKFDYCTRKDTQTGGDLEDSSKFKLLLK